MIIKILPFYGAILQLFDNLDLFNEGYSCERPNKK